MGGEDARYCLSSRSRCSDTPELVTMGVTSVEGVMRRVNTTSEYWPRFEGPRLGSHARLIAWARQMRRERHSSCVMRLERSLKILRDAHDRKEEPVIGWSSDD